MNETELVLPLAIISAQGRMSLGQWCPELKSCLSP